MSYAKKDEEPPRTKAKKDTKKWCKGKVGVQHDPMWVYRPGKWGLSLGTKYECQVCKKQLDYCGVGEKLLEVFSGLQCSGTYTITLDVTKDPEELLEDLLNNRL